MRTGLFRRAVEVPVSAAITGTAIATIDEADIVSGGKTIIITLTGDTWVATGATFDAQRQNIINGIDSAQAEAAGWDAEVKANLAVTTVVRTSDTIVTVTLSAQASFDISAPETITATIPASALTISPGEIIAVPAFTVANASIVWTYNIAIVNTYLRLTPTMTMTVADVDAMLKNGVITISGGQIVDLSALSYTRDKTCDTTGKDEYLAWHSAGFVNIWNPPCGVDVRTFEYHSQWSTSISAPATLGVINIQPRKVDGFWVDVSHWANIGITNGMTADYVE